MLDPYISKEDIMRLLNDWMGTKRLINRTDFQIALTKLKQYKKPQNEIGFKVNNAHSILQNITKYSNSDRCKELCNERRKYLRIANDEYFKFIDANTEEDLEEWIIVETGRDLAIILGITEQTVVKWRNDGIIKRHYKGLEYVCGTIRHIYWLKLGYYYNLNEITENIKSLK